MQHIKLPADTTESSLLATIQRLNFDPSVHGILLQLPLDTTDDVDSDKCTNAIAVEKVSHRFFISFGNQSIMVMPTVLYVSWISVIYKKFCVVSKRNSTN